jgi:hypothetical protein
MANVTKKCTKCSKNKSLDQYTRRGNSIKSWCKQGCSEYSDKWNKNNPDKIKASRLKCQHNVSLDVYKVKLDSQNGLCAICYKAPTRQSNLGTMRTLCLDHCHKTGQIRDLLCDNCNTAVGLLKDDIKIANNLVNYLIKHGDKNGNAE